MTDTCRICGSTEYEDHPVHGGRSIRRDCNKCWKWDAKCKNKWHPFIRFVVWNGKEVTDVQSQKSQEKVPCLSAGAI